MAVENPSTSNERFAVTSLKASTPTKAETTIQVCVCHHHQIIAQPRDIRHEYTNVHHDSGALIDREGASGSRAGGKSCVLDHNKTVGLVAPTGSQLRCRGIWWNGGCTGSPRPIMRR
jgi:hypothetical protein